MAVPLPCIVAYTHGTRGGFLLRQGDVAKSKPRAPHGMRQQSYSCNPVFCSQEDPVRKPAPTTTHLRTAKTTYKYKVIYPSCKRGYWDSGCGQPEIKQKATGVRCFAVTGDTERETDEKHCIGLNKPVPTDRTCPKTKPCRE